MKLTSNQKENLLISAAMICLVAGVLLMGPVAYRDHESRIPPLNDIAMSVFQDAKEDPSLRGHLASFVFESARCNDNTQLCVAKASVDAGRVLTYFVSYQADTLDDAHIVIAARKRTDTLTDTIKVSRVD